MLVKYSKCQKQTGEIATVINDVCKSGSRDDNYVCMLARPSDASLEIVDHEDGRDPD